MMSPWLFVVSRTYRAGGQSKPSRRGRTA